MRKHYRILLALALLVGFPTVSCTLLTEVDRTQIPEGVAGSPEEGSGGGSAAGGTNGEGGLGGNGGAN